MSLSMVLKFLLWTFGRTYAKTHPCERLSPRETLHIQAVSIAIVKEYMEGSLPSVQYCFWQQGCTLTGKSLWDKGVSDYIECLSAHLSVCMCVYCCEQSSIKVYRHYRKETGDLPVHSENNVVAVKKENAIFQSLILFLPVLSSFPAVPFSVFSLSISVAPSISLNPHRHLCDNNGTPVGVRLVSLWQ